MLNARAAVVHDAGADPQLADVQIREPYGDEVLVRIDAVGICHTDVSVAARFRKLPMVFGHEGAGTVIGAGPDAVPRVGDQVVLTFASCGTCPNCQADSPAYCEQSTDLNMRGTRDGSSALHADGAPIGGGFFGQSSFCTHAIAGSRNAVVLPEPIDPALAAPLGCSVQTGVGAVLNVLAPQPTDALVVFGAGPSDSRRSWVPGSRDAQPSSRSIRSRRGACWPPNWVPPRRSTRPPPTWPRPCWS